MHTGSVGAYVRRARTESKQFDLVFLDPPYDAAHEYATTLGLLGGAAANLLSTGAVAIAEHRRKERLEDRYGSLARTRLLEQGDAALSFYSILEPAAAG
jgi:16S rRNA G966 N2-methylase RsmD